MGVAAALSSAFAWALSSTLLASQTARVDFVSITALRAVWALLFLLVMAFALGAAGDIAHMSVGDALAIAATGILGSAIGETGYVATVAMIGMTRAFTSVTAVYVLFTYIGAVLVLDETLSWEVALGSVLVLAGVFLVTIYGRARPASGAPPAAPSASGSLPSTGRWPARWLRRRRTATIAGGSGAEAPPPEPPEAFLCPAWLRPRLLTVLLVMLVPAVFWAISSVWLRSVSEDFDAAAVGVVRLPLVVLILMAFAYRRRDSSLRRNTISLRGHGALAASGILGTGLTLLLFIWALQQIGPGQTAVLFSTSPLFALPMGFLFLRERPTLGVVLGTGVAVAGIVLLA